MAQIVDGDIGVVLRGDDDGIDALDRARLIVLDGDLALAVRTQPRERAVLAAGGERLCEIVRIGNRRGHQLFRFAAGKAEHHALVAGAGIVGVAEGMVHAHGDIAGLLVNRGEDCAGAVVEAAALGITDSADGFSCDGGDIHVAVGGNFAHHEHHARGCRALAGDACFGVLRQDGVEHAVGDLVAHLIGVTFRYGFRCKDSFFHVFSFLSERKTLCTWQSDYSSSFLICRFSRRIWHLVKYRLPGFTGPVPPPLLIRYLIVALL